MQLVCVEQLSQFLRYFWVRLVFQVSEKKFLVLWKGGRGAWDWEAIRELAPEQETHSFLPSVLCKLDRWLERDQKTIRPLILVANDPQVKEKHTCGLGEVLASLGNSRQLMSRQLRW